MYMNIFIIQIKHKVLYYIIDPYFDYLKELIQQLFELELCDKQFLFSLKYIWLAGVKQTELGMGKCHQL